MSKSPLQILAIHEVPTSLQLVETLKSLQKISPIDIESKQFKTQLKQYAQEHLILYKESTTGQGQQNYICFLKEQQINNEYYINQYQQEVFKVDHLHNTIIQRKQSPQPKLSQQNSKFIKLVKQKLDLYINQHYSRPSAATCYLHVVQNNIEQISIGLTSKKYNANNFYSGEWTSYWKFKKTSYEGNINVRNHYFQNGNIMFQRNKPIAKNIENQKFIDQNVSVQIMVDKIIKTIKNEEQSYQKQIQKLFADKIAKSLKKIRRISPITQGKMIWNVNAVLLSQNLAETHLQQN